MQTFRQIRNSQAASGRSGSKRSAARQACRNVCCTTSSARSASTRWRLANDTNGRRKRACSSRMASGSPAQNRRPIGVVTDRRAGAVERAAGHAPILRPEAGQADP